ncbi:MAG TPA: hypothetical protein VGM64_11860 [Lacunisphaera sp.]|jgi:hypothetical protein
MKLLFLQFLAIFLAFSSPLRSENETANQGDSIAIELPTVTVTADWFRVSYRCDRKTDRVLKVVVTEITPGGPASGIDFKKGDLLVAIDQRPVVGMLRIEFLAFLERTLEAGHPKVFSFVRRLGLFGGKTKSFDLIFTAKEKKVA